MERDISRTEVHGPLIEFQEPIIKDSRFDLIAYLKQYLKEEVAQGGRKGIGYI
jgi:hypothetical protein